MNKLKDIGNKEVKKMEKNYSLTNLEIDISDRTETVFSILGRANNEKQIVSLTLWGPLSDKDNILPKKGRNDILSIYEGLNKLVTNLEFLMLKKDSENYPRFLENNHDCSNIPTDRDVGTYYYNYYGVRSEKFHPWKEIGCTSYLEEVTHPDGYSRYSVCNSLEKQLIAHNYKVVSSLKYTPGFEPWHLGRFTKKDFVPLLDKEVREMVQKFKKDVLKYFKGVESLCDTREKREEARKIAEMNEWRAKRIKAEYYK